MSGRDSTLICLADLFDQSLLGLYGIGEQLIAIRAAVPESKMQRSPT